MKIKNEYEKIVNERFNGKTRELLLENIELFYKNDIDIVRNKYNIGDNVFLKKGTFILCNLDGKVIL